MTSWMCIYAAGVLLIPLTIGIIVTHEDKIYIDDSTDFLLIYGAILIWPLILSIIPAVALAGYLVNCRKERTQKVASKYNIPDDSVDRSYIVAIPDNDLKILLRGVRSKHIRMHPVQVEAIREELKNRLVERTLLR